MKKYFFPALLLSAMLIPSLASAESPTTAVSTSTPTSSQIFTLCQQAAIEKRDTSIAAARTAYNTTMSQALDTRKNAEKATVAITDTVAKASAVKTAVNSYKRAVVSAQGTLTKSRKDALAVFETDTLKCRQNRRDERSASVAEKKSEIGASSTETKSQMQNIRSEQKTQAETKRSEIKILRDTFMERLDAIRSFFGR